MNLEFVVCACLCFCTTITIFECAIVLCLNVKMSAPQHRGFDTWPFGTRDSNRGGANS